MTKRFVLYWKNGEEEIVEGRDILDAFMKSGYGAGATAALDHYKPLNSDDPSTSDSALKEEINRLYQICIDGHKQDYKGDPQYENVVYEELDHLGCWFPCASNYDFKSSWNGAQAVLAHLKRIANEKG
ncbi:MAG: hypothetical protein PVG65_05770 [Candidatus Thorarchaeota archaeon]|jgi:hypothetical protein